MPTCKVYQLKIFTKSLAVLFLFFLTNYISATDFEIIDFTKNKFSKNQSDNNKISSQAEDEFSKKLTKKIKIVLNQIKTNSPEFYKYIVNQNQSILLKNIINSLDSRILFYPNNSKVKNSKNSVFIHNIPKEKINITQCSKLNAASLKILKNELFAYNKKNNFTNIILDLRQCSNPLNEKFLTEIKKFTFSNIYIILLVSSSTSGAAELFISKFHGHKKVIIIGEPTSGKQKFKKPVKVKNLGLIFLPQKTNNFLKKSSKILPDIEMINNEIATPDQIKNNSFKRDKILFYSLELLKSINATKNTFSK